MLAHTSTNSLIKAWERLAIYCNSLSCIKVDSYFLSQRPSSSAEGRCGRTPLLFLKWESFPCMFIFHFDILKNVCAFYINIVLMLDYSKSIIQINLFIVIWGVLAPNYFKQVEILWVYLHFQTLRFGANCPLKNVSKCNNSKLCIPDIIFLAIFGILALRPFKQAPTLWVYLHFESFYDFREILIENRFKER